MAINQRGDIVSVTSQYIIFRNMQYFTLFFAPKDLVNRQGEIITPIDGLGRAYERRKSFFLENIREISELRRKNCFGNILPDYSIISEKQGILYVQSRYYDAEKLTKSDEDTIFFRKLSTLCSFMQAIIDKTGHIPGIQLDDVIFERREPEQLHVLYLNPLCENENPFNEQIWMLLIQKYYDREPQFKDRFLKHKFNWIMGQHPKFSKLLHQLLSSLQSPANWSAASETVKEIIQLLKTNPDYLTNPYHAPCLKEFPTAKHIQEAFSSGQHIVFLNGTNKKQLRQIIDSYLSNASSKYLHIAKGNASNGLSAMLESDTFALHSGAVSVNERLLALTSISKEGLMLIIEDCDLESDAVLFSKFIRLPADILFLTRNNYEEYGFVSITI